MADTEFSIDEMRLLRCAGTGVALTHGGGGRIRFEERASDPTEVG